MEASNGLCVIGDTASLSQGQTTGSAKEERQNR